MHRYPENTVATVQDFRRSGWKAAINLRDRDGYSTMWSSLSDAARKAAESGNDSEAKVLWTLADACSMMLRPRSSNEPFKPIMMMEGRRSALPEDFDEEDLSLLSDILEEIDDVWLKARLADLLWLREIPRNPNNALAAIDSYRAIAIDTKTWIRGGQECWERAIGLARMLRGGAGDRITEMQSAIVDSLDASRPEDGFLALWLAHLLAENGLARDRGPHIATKLESIGHHFDAEGDLRCAREYYSASSKWFELVDDTSKAVETTVAVAESWAKEALARQSAEQPSHLQAASLFESAIQTYRTIPRSQRDTYRVDERIAELHRMMNDAGERSLDEMGVIKSPPIDITEMCKSARESVESKSWIDALAGLANVASGAQVANFRDLAESTLHDSPLVGLLSATHVSRDGRVVAKSPGLGLGDPDSEDYQATLRAQMIKNYVIYLGITVQGCIWPALEVFTLEHRIREDDLVSIALRSPLVPPGRERLFGKALFAGIEKDFAAAIHLLVPQIEHMVRFHLKAAGVRTTNINQAGVEHENGLRALMDLSDTDEVFGEDLTFELRALFCDSYGPNLRNEVAHGLLDDNWSQSSYAIYTWWFGLRLVFITFWNSAMKVGVPEGDAQSET